ncbi:hypothetical protein BDZ91DRAFT_768943 [Kalaharituber pfeilii]|nr:hypothetical protein BDZ91DRAFT_768943 [Kalaharituber pfeilii]
MTASSKSRSHALLDSLTSFLEGHVYTITPTDGFLSRRNIDSMPRIQGVFLCSHPSNEITNVCAKEYMSEASAELKCRYIILVASYDGQSFCSSWRQRPHSMRRKVPISANATCSDPVSALRPIGEPRRPKVTLLLDISVLIDIPGESPNLSTKYWEAAVKMRITSNPHTLKKCQQMLAALGSDGQTGTGAEFTACCKIGK